MWSLIGAETPPPIRFEYATDLRRPVKKISEKYLLRHQI